MERVLPSENAAPDVVILRRSLDRDDPHAPIDEARTLTGIPTLQFFGREEQFVGAGVREHDRLVLRGMSKG